MNRILLLGSFILFAFSYYGQENRISVKKKDAVSEKKELEGFYYSQPMVQEFKNGSGITSYKQIRYFLFVDNNKSVSLFTSPLSPKKAFKKFTKNRKSLIDEQGEYSTSDNSLYLTTNTIGKSYSTTYRYVGEISNDYLYLNYKAAFKQKVALDIYLYKYNGIN